MVKNARHKLRPPRGFMTLEATIAIALTIGLMAAFTAYTMQSQKGMRAFSDKRTAVRLAEETLITLRTAAAQPDARVTIRKLSTPAEAPTQVWVEVTATIAGRSATLTGLVPEASMKEAK